MALRVLGVARALPSSGAAADEPAGKTKTPGLPPGTLSEDAMKRTLLFAFLIVLGFGLSASAQTPAGTGTPGTGQGPSWVDANGNGICDLFEARGQTGQAGQGKRYGAGKGAGQGQGQATGAGMGGPRDGYGPGSANCTGTGTGQGQQARRRAGR